MKTLASDGATFVPMAVPFNWWKILSWNLNTLYFKTNLKRCSTNFRGIGSAWLDSRWSKQYWIPSSWGMDGYSCDTSHVARMQLVGNFLEVRIWVRDLVSLRRDGILCNSG